MFLVVGVVFCVFRSCLTLCSSANDLLHLDIVTLGTERNKFPRKGQAAQRKIQTSACVSVLKPGGGRSLEVAR